MGVINALWKRNMKIFWRNKPSLILNLTFPFFFMFIFSAVFGQFLGDGVDVITFMIAGIIVSTMFESSFRISSSTIDDISGGFMKEILVAPTSRVYIALGQFVSSAMVATIQGVLILGISFAFGFRVTSLFTVVYALLAMVFIGLVFAGFGLMIAAKSKNLQTFQAVSAAVLMPMTFISGAYIPLGALPQVARWIGYVNPLSYAVLFFRTITMELTHLPPSELLAFDLAFDVGGNIIGWPQAVGILIIFGGVFLVASSLSFARLDFSRLNRKSVTFSFHD